VCVRRCHVIARSRVSDVYTQRAFIPFLAPAGNPMAMAGRFSLQQDTLVDEEYREDGSRAIALLTCTRASTTCRQQFYE
jgi:hypothetical protein